MKRGFTYIELLVSLAITSLIILISYFALEFSYLIERKTSISSWQKTTIERFLYGNFRNELPFRNEFLLIKKIKETNKGVFYRIKIKSRGNEKSYTIFKSKILKF